MTGYSLSFAAQAIICTFGLIPVYLLLRKYGPGLRASRPMYVKTLNGIDGRSADVVRGDSTSEELVVSSK